MSKPALVIGDVHGHFDRLEALLLQEGIIGVCPDCDGVGDREQPLFQFEPAAELGRDDMVFQFEPDPFCARCQGTGQARINFDVDVIQIGDLGHWGGHTGSPTGDKLCFEFAPDFFDVVLWGNHDRALVDPFHIFGGYEHPGEVKALVDRLYSQGKMRMAAARHGYLLVHAGVGLGFEYITKRFQDAAIFAEFLNSLDEQKIEFLRTHKQRGFGVPRYSYQGYDEKHFRILDAISAVRGGGAQVGGVLWFDWQREKHLKGDPFKFICGHTANRDGLFQSDEWGNWCIDIGGKTEARLGGLWLREGEEPEMVRVDL